MIMFMETKDKLKFDSALFTNALIGEWFILYKEFS